MDYLSLVLVFLVFMAIALFVMKNNSSKKNKNETITKEEIISRYKNKVLDLKQNTSSENYNKQKILLLKEISSELHRNIFFDDYEAKAIIKDLASL